MTVAFERLLDLVEVSGPSALYVAEERSEVFPVVPVGGVAVPPRLEPLTQLGALCGLKTTDGEE